MVPNPIISLGEARKILGAASKDITDERLEALLKVYGEIARGLTEYYGSK